MRKSSILSGIGFATAIVGGLLAMHNATSNSVSVTPTPAITVTNTTFTIPECATEDSDNCIWNADVQGNGKGRSFIVYNGVYYYAK